MFQKKTKTFLSRYMLVNPFNILMENEVLKEKGLFDLGLDI
jgi:hypothetical protein